MGKHLDFRLSSIMQVQGLTHLASAIALRSVIPGITAATGTENTGACQKGSDFPLGLMGLTHPCPERPMKRSGFKITQAAPVIDILDSRARRD